MSINNFHPSKQVHSNKCSLICWWCVHGWQWYDVLDFKKFVRLLICDFKIDEKLYLEGAHGCFIWTLPIVYFSKIFFFDTPVFLPPRGNPPLVFTGPLEHKSRSLRSASKIAVTWLPQAVNLLFCDGKHSHAIYLYIAVGSTLWTILIVEGLLSCTSPIESLCLFPSNLCRL